MKSHLVSQFVLKQFSDESGMVMVHDLATSTSTPKMPENIAYIDIDKRIIGELELEWGQGIETLGAQAINVLRNGDLLHQPKHADAMKAVIGLHYVRSRPFIELLSRAQDEKRAQLVASLTDKFPNMAPAEVKAHIDAEWPARMTEVYVGLLKENIAKVNKYLRSHELEVGTAPQDCPLLIGDSPVVNISEDGRTGLVAGVSIDQSTSAGMPITPTHLVTFSSNPNTQKYLDLTRQHVKAANDKQIGLAHAEYYSVPT